MFSCQKYVQLLKFENFEIERWLWAESALKRWSHLTRGIIGNGKQIQITGASWQIVRIRTNLNCFTCEERCSAAMANGCKADRLVTNLFSCCWPNIETRKPLWLLVTEQPCKTFQRCSELPNSIRWSYAIGWRNEPAFQSDSEQEDPPKTPRL